MTRHFLDDASGPDGTRVSISVEQDIHRLIVWRERLGLRAWFVPFNKTANDAAARFVQRRLLAGRWAVVAEGDEGTRRRMVLGSRSEAVRAAEQLRHSVNARGVQALYDWDLHSSCD